MNQEPRTFYRVRPESNSYSHEDYDTLEEAVKRASERNSLRISEDEKDRVYKSHNCIIQKVEQTITNITY